VTVRFLPTRYIPPQRVGHDVTEVQQEVLAILSGSGRMALSEIHAALGDKVTLRSLKDELAMLKRLEPIDSRGRGRGARWFLK
jgi:ATP-dependent DNA helicase RecG